MAHRMKCADGSFLEIPREIEVQGGAAVEKWLKKEGFKAPVAPPEKAKPKDEAE